MSGSQNENTILAAYRDKRSVFTLTDIAVLVGESDFNAMNGKVNYYVRTGRLLNPRKGIYAKAGYPPEELACVLYTPSYISLEYVLQRAGIIFQYDERITSVSYLSRNIEIENRTFSYRKIKGEILVVTKGLNREGNVNIASPERAFLDLLYLNRQCVFDNLNPLNKELIDQLLPLYGSKALVTRVQKLLKDGEY
ncbi:MAG: hypothetical protein PHI28_17850 [Mangrovibacterium sp.]|nr:hypothetical protein [Mangrovibacterium sp.]